ncbi:DNA-binding GntR family transcriptional regulator [Evansella vedderi]|uniref:DNA-binding GntR family transcriptional regulator n=1 Tax=Evansella vedderi TaxID=38282 RepID=A0ABT9ZYJ0_9BACI|nr:GntR family transcriptional regulator [Evansella vedderi]MDQ0256304.1 DNA-binding GntR family transcriptional regulator [Evansella vedderi]
MDPYEFIKNAIITGKYKPGLRLTEEFLAKEIAVSRTPVREALKRLKFDGLVTSLNRGLMVREFTKNDVKQIYDLRALLESFAAKEAALSRDEEDLLEMERLINEFESLLECDLGNEEITRKIMDNNSRFHDTVIRASKNEHLHFHISKVVVLPLVFVSFYWFNRKDIQRSYEAHAKLFDAIRNRDFEKAMVVMQDHIFTGRDFVLTSEETLKYFHKEVVK